MYRQLLEKLIHGHSYAKLCDPCPEKDIESAEKAVGFPFPDELKALLRETDGDKWFLLSAQEIIENTDRNRNILAEYLEPEEFTEKVDRNIYFATNGCGDYYCYRVNGDGKADTSAICIWEHETFDTVPVAKDLEDAIIKYYNDEI